MRSIVLGIGFFVAALVFDLRAQESTDPFSPALRILFCESVHPDSVGQDSVAVTLSFDERETPDEGRVLHAQYDSAGTPLALAVLRMKVNSNGQKGLEVIAVKFDRQGGGGGARVWRPVPDGASAVDSSRTNPTGMLTENVSPKETAAAKKLAGVLWTRGCDKPILSK